MKQRATPRLPSATDEMRVGEREAAHVPPVAQEHRHQVPCVPSTPVLAQMVRPDLRRLGQEEGVTVKL